MQSQVRAFALIISSGSLVSFIEKSISCLKRIRALRWTGILGLSLQTRSEIFFPISNNRHPKQQMRAQAKTKAPKPIHWWMNKI